MRRRLSRLAPLAGLLLLLSLAFPGPRAFFREDVVAPLLYLLWVAYLLLSSVPQVAYWAALVLVVLALAWRQLSLPGTKRRTAKQAEPLARLAEWAQLLEQAPRASYDRWRLAQRLARLSAELLAELQRLPAGEVRRALAKGAFELPPPLGAYLEQGLSRHEPWSEPRAFWKGRVETRFAYAEVAALLDYLEAQLEGRVHA